MEAEFTVPYVLVRHHTPLSVFRSQTHDWSGEPHHRSRKAYGMARPWAVAGIKLTSCFADSCSTGCKPTSGTHKRGFEGPGATRWAPGWTDEPDLVAVVTAWPDLPEAVKAGIVAMVQASRP